MVLHAAAYKHVPMMEHHPADAITTNLGGTLATLRASLVAGVEQFVLVSTDKAVDPSSVMGATKRLAEIAVATIARQSGRRYVSVRFGNVLGSSGSVVPLFQRQLREGVPLTITDPEMTRYFMTIPDASRLIREASLLGEAGDLFVLDMGEPVRIVDLARDLARLAGRDPDSIPIQYIGLRPGEKLHETLFYDAEAIEPTGHPKVLRARDLAPHPADDQIIDALDALVVVAATGNHAAARAALAETIGWLQPPRVPRTATAREALAAQIS
jgi:FlaA1/EpsC-like NDP-sugar epimerase